jgi:hypothetical protein
MGKSTRVRCPSDETGSASRDGAATAAAHQPRLEELGLTKPLLTPEDPGKQHRSAAAVAAMRAVAALVTPDENDSLFPSLGLGRQLLGAWSGRDYFCRCVVAPTCQPPNKSKPPDARRRGGR